MFKTALIVALAAPAAAFVDGRAPAANQFFSKQAFTPGQLDALAKSIPDDSIPALRTCYERVALDTYSLASIWGADVGDRAEINLQRTSTEASAIPTPTQVGAKVPAAAQVGGFVEHHDTSGFCGKEEWVDGTVKILYLEAGEAPARFVLVDEETKEEFSAQIEPGLVVEYDNKRYAHRIDGSDASTRKFLGPAIYGSDLGLIGDGCSPGWTASGEPYDVMPPCEDSETEKACGDCIYCKWDTTCDRRNLRFGETDCGSCEPKVEGEDDIEEPEEPEEPVPATIHTGKEWCWSPYPRNGPGSLDESMESPEACWEECLKRSGPFADLLVAANYEVYDGLDGSPYGYCECMTECQCMDGPENDGTTVITRDSAIDELPPLCESGPGKRMLYAGAPSFEEFRKSHKSHKERKAHK